MTLPQHPQFGDSFGLITTEDKTFVVPGWYEVPNGTTRNDITFEPKPKTLPTTKSWSVPSSKGTTTYTVTNNGGTWACTCPQNQYRRRTCKHITQLQS